MDIATHQLRSGQSLAQRKTAANSKSLVHADQSLNPRIYKQVIANTYLDGSGITCFNQQYIEKCRIEHYIAMIRHECVSLTLVIRSN